MVKFTQFRDFEELQEKSAFFKISAQTFQAEDFVNIFLRFWGF